MLLTIIKKNIDEKKIPKNKNFLNFFSKKMNNNIEAKYIRKGILLPVKIIDTKKNIRDKIIKTIFFLKDLNKKTTPEKIKKKTKFLKVTTSNMFITKKTRRSIKSNRVTKQICPSFYLN